MMKLTRIILVLVILFSLQGCYATRAYKYRKFELSTLDKLDATMLPASDQPYRFLHGTAKHERLKWYLDANLENSRTYAFLVIRNDSILYEKYYGTIGQSTKLPSFSVAKSFVSTLIGIAFEEGKIKSLHEPITDYIPELARRDQRFAKITIQHLLDMRSGVDSDEGYENPFSDVLKMGFTKNIRSKTLKVKYGKEPGGDFEYRSVNTQLLAMILEKATGRPIQDYMKEKLWLPLGIQYEASWNIDSRKRQQVRAFSCLNAAALDYAKLGQLIINEGTWNGRQIISRDWVRKITSTDTLNKYGGYKDQWWSNYSRLYFADSSEAYSAAIANPFKPQLAMMTNKDSTKFYQIMYRDAIHADGLLEQVVYVNKEKKLIIVRLGHDWEHKKYSSADNFIYSLGTKF
jgi:CubicO group peptidase (beta-lactamase class C family)